MSDHTLVETPNARSWWARLGRSRSRPLAGESAAPDTMANVRRAGIAMLVAFALMELFNSDGLRSYACDLPPGWLADHAVAGADAWHQLMVALGPAELRPAIRKLFEDFRKMTW